MLPRVTGKNHSRISVTGQTQQCEHLPSTNLPSLIHDHNRPRGEFTLEKETRDR